MKIIGIAFIVIGFLDFGLYLLSLVSSINMNFMPPLLVFGAKDYTDVALIILGYFLKGLGENKESSAASDTEPDTESKEEQQNR